MIEQADSQTARKTTLTVATVLFVIGAWQVYRHRPFAAWVFIGAAAVLFAIALLVPPFARAFHRGWMALAGVLAYVNTRILLALVFYLIVTPSGTLRKWLGHDPLARRSPRQTSYWTPKAMPRQSKEGFERMF